MTAPTPPAAKSPYSWWMYVGACGVICAIGFGMGYCAGRPNTSAAQAEVAHLRADSTALAHKLDSLSKVRRGDSIAVAASSLSYDALKNRYLVLQRARTVAPVSGAIVAPTQRQIPTSLKEGTPSTVQSDTTTPTVPQVFAACDTLTKALRQALADCGAQQSVYKAQAAVSESTATAYRSLAPDYLQRHESALVGLTAALALVLGLIVGRK